MDIRGKIDIIHQKIKSTDLFTLHLILKYMRFFVPVSNEKGVHQRLPGVSPSRSHVGQRATLPLSGGDSTESGTITVLFFASCNLTSILKNGQFSSFSIITSFYGLLRLLTRGHLTDPSL